MHSLVVTEEGALYSFGRGDSGTLGYGNEDAERFPKMVDALRHVRIAAGAAGVNQSLALAEDGKNSLLLGTQPPRPARPWAQWRD